MRIPRQAVGVLLLLGGLFFAFSNCQQDIGFGSVPSEVGAKGAPNAGVAPTATTPPDAGPGPTMPPTIEPLPPLAPPTPPQTPGEVKKSCENTRHESKMASALFPKPNMTCDWNAGGNLAPLNGYLQARIEQSSVLNLPAGATICNMTFSFSKQQFLYDDHFLMTFDNAVLASSYDFSGILSAENSLQIYDWSRIAGKHWDTNREGVFCAAVTNAASEVFAGSCRWPSTDVAGTIEMSFPREVFYSVMAMNPGRLEHEFKFMSIGDNDDQDCEHSEVQFQVVVEYIQ